MRLLVVLLTLSCLVTSFAAQANGGQNVKQKEDKPATQTETTTPKNDDKEKEDKELTLKEVEEALKKRFDQVLNKVKDVLQGGREITAGVSERLKVITKKMKDFAGEIDFRKFDKVIDFFRRIFEKEEVDETKSDKVDAQKVVKGSPNSDAKKEPVKSEKEVKNSINTDAKKDKDTVKSVNVDEIGKFEQLKAEISKRFESSKIKSKIEELFGKGDKIGESLIKLLEKGAEGKKKLQDFVNRYIEKKKSSKSSPKN